MLVLIFNLYLRLNVIRLNLLSRKYLLYSAGGINKVVKRTKDITILLLVIARYVFAMAYIFRFLGVYLYLQKYNLMDYF